MDAKQFDSVARVVGQGTGRRQLLAGLVGAMLAGSLGRATVTAKGKQRHRVTAQDDTPKPNGKKCTKNAQCRSLNCVGATGRGATGVCQCLSTCDGQACGADDGCGGKCQTGSCPNATCATCHAGQCVNVTGNCTTAGGYPATCNQGTCCTEGTCTGAGQCCGSLVCTINYSVSTGYCTTCLDKQAKCDIAVGGCCEGLSCQAVVNGPSWCN
jgi:hypothetical protein